MNKTVIRVFAVVGVLVIVFIFWQLTFSTGGGLRSAYNAVAEAVNTATNSTVMPMFDTSAYTNPYGNFDLGTTFP